jgi:hypothetical protein
MMANSTANPVANPNTGNFFLLLQMKMFTIKLAIHSLVNKLNFFLSCLVLPGFFVPMNPYENIFSCGFIFNKSVYDVYLILLKQFAFYQAFTPFTSNFI